ncbi:MAG: N-acetylneuraminate synthase family protein [Candidatus Omnitrophota bacterium]
MHYEDLIPENGYVVAEIACGHGGDPAKLKKLIDCAALSNARIVKFQIFTLEERLDPRWDIFAKLVLPQQAWEEAARYARQKGLVIFADIFGESSLKLARELGVEGFKVHSEDMLNSSFVAKVAAEGKITMISVGGAHRIEIYQLVNFLKTLGLLKNIILVTGFQAYPTPIEDHSLWEVADLIEKYSPYGIKVAFADHVSGDLPEAKAIPLMALAKGACLVEKHITVNRKRKWVDYQSALSKDDFTDFIGQVNQLAPLLKKTGYFTSSEEKYRKTFKKSACAASDLKNGRILAPDDFGFNKNNTDEVPSLAALSLIGKELKVDVKKGEFFRSSQMKGKVGGIIVARCSSNRLPNKALCLIDGRESIAVLIDRIKRCKRLDCIILATSTDHSDDILVEIANREGILPFRGSLENVSSRFYEAAKYYGLDHFVRITGDAILCDEVMIDHAVKSHLHSCCDATFMKNMPFGTHKEVVSMNTIRTILDTAAIPSNTEYLEYYLENSRYFNINYVAADYVFDHNLRITLDYEEDLELFRRIYGHFNKINPAFTLRDALAWLGEHPEIAKINMHKRQKFLSHQLNVELHI